MKIVNGLNAYDILKMPECPIKLPSARSMTQAKIDFEFNEDRIIKWYVDFKKEETSKALDFLSEQAQELNMGY